MPVLDSLRYGFLELSRVHLVRYLECPLVSFLWAEFIHGLLEGEISWKFSESRLGTLVARERDGVRVAII